MACKKTTNILLLSTFQILTSLAVRGRGEEDGFAGSEGRCGVMGMGLEGGEDACWGVVGVWGTAGESMLGWEAMRFRAN